MNAPFEFPITTKREEMIVRCCAVICRAQIQVGPSASLFIAAQNTMAAQCAEEIERTFGLIGNAEPSDRLLAGGPGSVSG